MDKYLELKKIFEENMNEENSIKMSNYMQNKFKFYGIDSKTRKQLQKDFIKQEKQTKKIDYDFLYKCYDDEHREFHYFALDCLDNLSKYLTFNDVEKLEYFVKNNQWWDSIDAVDKLIGNIDDKRIDELMLKWSKHDNMWNRRLSINHQLTKGNNTNTLLLEQIIVNNLGSNEFFINKAIGWSLRDYSKINPIWVKDFINKYKDKMDKLSIKEASKYI